MKQPLDLIRERIIQLGELGKKKNKESVFFIQFSPTPTKQVLVPRNRETDLTIVGFCELNGPALLEQICGEAEGKVDHIFLDLDRKLPGLAGTESIAHRLFRKTRLHYYRDNAAWSDALLSLTTALCPPHLVSGKPKRALIVGDGILVNKLALGMAEFSYAVTICSPSAGEKSSEVAAALRLILQSYENVSIAAASSVKALIDGAETFDLIVGASFKTVVLNEDVLKLCHPGTVLLDGGIGTVSVELVPAAYEKGLKIYRLDNRAAISAVIQLALETEDLVRFRMGRDVIAGVPVVAGGVMGQNGDVVVDSVTSPTTVMGVADGTGKFHREEELSPEDLARIAKLESLMYPAR